MTATMRAVVLDAPGPPEALVIRELPVPEPRPGWVLIRVKAFGINRSELHTRLGLARVRHDCLLRATAPGSSADGTAPFAQRQTSTGMSQPIDIPTGVRLY